MTEGKVGQRKARRSGLNIEKHTLLKLSPYKEFIHLIEFGQKTAADEAKLSKLHQALMSRLLKLFYKMAKRAILSVS